MSETTRPSHAAGLEEARVELLEALAHLQDIEVAKGDLDVGSEAYAASSREAVEIGEAILRWVKLELRLAELARRGGATSDASLRPDRHLDAILGDWRAALRDQEAAPSGSPAERSAGDVAWELRSEYAEVSRRLRERLAAHAARPRDGEAAREGIDP